MYLKLSEKIIQNCIGDHFDVLPDCNMNINGLIYFK